MPTLKCSTSHCCIAALFIITFPSDWDLPAQTLAQRYRQSLVRVARGQGRLAFAAKGKELKKNELINAFKKDVS